MKKQIKHKKDEYIRIPVVLRHDDRQFALSVKQAVETREGRSITWAALVRLAFKSLAKTEGVKCL